MNARETIVAALKKSDMTIVELAVKTGLDKVATRNHVKALAKGGGLRVGKGAPGRNGSPLVSIVNAAKAETEAAAWAPRGAGAATNGEAKAPRKVKGAKRGRKAKSAPPEETTGSYLVAYLPEGGEPPALVESFDDQQEAIACALAKGGTLYASTELAIVHTVAPVVQVAPTTSSN